MGGVWVPAPTYGAPLVAASWQPEQLGKPPNLFSRSFLPTNLKVQFVQDLSDSHSMWLGKGKGTYLRRLYS